MEIHDILYEGEILQPCSEESIGVITFERREYPFNFTFDRSRFKRGDKVWFLGSSPEKQNLEVGLMVKKSIFKPILITFGEDLDIITPDGSGTVSDQKPPAVREGEIFYFDHINERLEVVNFEAELFDYITFDNDSDGNLVNIEKNKYGIWIR